MSGKPAEMSILFGSAELGSGIQQLLVSANSMNTRTLENCACKVRCVV